MAQHNDIGKIGEDIAIKFLMKHGFSIVSRNYRTKLGEIDIIANKDNVLRFVEVKSVKVRSISHVDNLQVKPEDNLTKEKWGKLVITIETFLQQKNMTDVIKWQVDLACVYINVETKRGLVKLIENVHKE